MYTTSINFKKSIAFIALSAVTILSAILVARPAHADLSTTMRIGSRGADVTELQTYLATDSSIYPQGLITGYFGSLTSAAVKRFQSAQGNLSVDGIVGPKTREKINSLMGMGGGGDIYAPDILSVTAASVGANSATITWNTSESTSGRVYYGSSHLIGTEGDFPNGFSLTGTIVNDTNTSLTGTHSVTLTGLASHTTYYYRSVSFDAAGNVTIAAEQSFTTQ